MLLSFLMKISFINKIKNKKKNKQTDGICFEKKEKVKKIADTNQNFFLFEFNAIIAKLTEIVEKIAAW